MNRKQFLQIATMTAIETYFFNEALMTEHYLLAIFWAYLLTKNLRAVYYVQKFLQTIDKEIQNKNKDKRF